MTETDVGAPSALIGTGKRALPQAPLLPQPVCQPSLPSGYATHTPRGIFCWLTVLRKWWEWFLCLPACSSWADLMEPVPLETAYLSLERILNSKIIDLWFCLYCSGRHTRHFTVVPDSRLPRTALNCSRYWEQPVSCSRHLPITGLRAWSHYVLVMACKRGWERAVDRLGRQKTDSKPRQTDASCGIYRAAVRLRAGSLVFPGLGLP